MGNLLKLPSGRSLVLTHRSASTSFVQCAIECYWTNLTVNNEYHPAIFLSNQEFYDGTQTNVCLIVRNPIDRFKSMLKHKPEYDINYWLSRPPAPLPVGNFDKYFLFETQLNECADWLGLYKPITVVNESDNTEIFLSNEQLSIVSQIYQNDIALWQSLQAS